jgi:hypothetical protein
MIEFEGVSMFEPMGADAHWREHSEHVQQVPSPQAHGSESFNRKFRDECLSQNCILNLEDPRATIGLCRKVRHTSFSRRRRDPKDPSPSRRSSTPPLLVVLVVDARGEEERRQPAVQHAPVEVSAAECF